MLRQHFGLDVKGATEGIQELLNTIDSVDSITAQMILRENYETIYKIHDHDKSTPMALVLCNPVENTEVMSALHLRIRRYHLHNIHSISGQDLISFLNNPKHINDLLFDIAVESLPGKPKNSFK